MNDSTLSFSLNEIALWQLNEVTSKVELPSLQRGFVWKVNQIEALWDSLLRGFPIGSLLLSKGSEDDMFLLDGQQRATSIALGYYNPWQQDNTKFWSLKKIPVLWVDLSPKENTETQKFVLRAVTQSHPWGYQKRRNDSILTVTDRRKALNIFKANPTNAGLKYVDFSLQQVFPYDAHIPVPICFLIEAVKHSNWKDALLTTCKENLPIDHMATKYTEAYLKSLQEILESEPCNDLISSVLSLSQRRVPGIIIDKDILKAEDTQPGDDPTLFIRLNASGTRIAGEELIYSIYKATYPQSKKLVEAIGMDFIAPSLVINLVARLAQSDLNGNTYPSPINVHNFRKLIMDEDFRSKLENLIAGGIAKGIFHKAITLLLSVSDVNTPPVLVKSIIKGQPELFLLLLRWIMSNPHLGNSREILGGYTSLLWFAINSTEYVKLMWGKGAMPNFWTNEVLFDFRLNSSKSLMFILPSPEKLREFLQGLAIEDEKFVLWGDVRPDVESSIAREMLASFEGLNDDRQNIFNDVWDHFRAKLFWNRSLLLFAQRRYINSSFLEFNQIDDLEDTNRPWDWDHIYPDSWVYYQQNINDNTRHWTWTIGNLRALSLEENRSERNGLSPKQRLENVHEQSFIQENDWKFWSKIERPVKEGDGPMIKNHIAAIATRLVNIYEEWYASLKIDKGFGASTIK
jgi:hypothetical protein